MGLGLAVHLLWALLKIAQNAYTGWGAFQQGRLGEFSEVFLREYAKVRLRDFEGSHLLHGYVEGRFKEGEHREPGHRLPQ